MCKIGVMRNGRLLVEDSPDSLLKIYQSDLLEQVVLQLCRRDADVEQLTPQVQTSNNVSAATEMDLDTSSSLWFQDSMISSSVTVTREEHANMAGKFWQRKKFDQDDNHRKQDARNNNSFSGGRVSSSLVNFQNFKPWQSLKRTAGFTYVLGLTLIRHGGLLALLLFIPTIQGAITLLALGSDPSGMGFGVVNQELQNWTTECAQPQHSGDHCDVSALSCAYFRQINRNNRLRLLPVESEDEALHQVHQGDTWGYMVIPPNYSRHGVDRAMGNLYSENATLDGFMIRARLDHSQFIGTSYVGSHLIDSFVVYLREAMAICDFGTNLADTPMLFRDPVYGKRDGNLTAFIMPGIIICSIMGITAGLAALLFIADEKQGTLSRARAAGMQSLEVMMGYLTIQGMVTIGQIFVWQLVLHFVFKFVILGPIWLWLLFCLLSGLCGTALGLLIGIVCPDEIESLIVAVFLIPIFLLFGGVVFPTEAINPFWLRIGRFIPTHLPTIALRSVVARGVGFTHPLVWPGFLAILAWIFVFLILSEMAFRKRIK